MTSPLDDLSTDAYRKIAILCAIAKYPGISTAELAIRTDIPDISVKRHLSRLRKDFMVDIVYVRTTGIRGKSGGYEVQDWGIIDKEELLNRYGDLVPEDMDGTTSPDIPVKKNAVVKPGKKTTSKATKAKNSASDKRRRQ